MAPEKGYEYSNWVKVNTKDGWKGLPVNVISQDM